MRIVSLQINNFLSAKEMHIDFESAGFTLIEGENGAGKSTIPDAIVWCLFGTTLRGYENDEVVHRKIGEDCLVSVFVENDGHAYAINRARRHSKFKNRLSVTNDDGEDMSGPSNTETQEIVNRLLGCTLKTFLSSCVFGQDRAYRFSSLTDKEQKEILDEVLGVERFAVACNVARAKAAVIDTAIDIARRDLETAEQYRDAAEAEAEEMKQKDAAFSSALAGKLKVEKEKLAKAKEHLKNTKVDVTKLKADLDQRRGEVSACESAVVVSNTEMTEARVLQGRAKVKVDDLRKHIERHEKLAGACPTCGQSIDATARDGVLADLCNRMTAATKAMAKIDAAVNEVGARLRESTVKVNKARDARLAAEKAYTEAVGAGVDTKAWKQRVADIEKRIEELNAEVNPYAQLAKKAKARFDRHEKEAKLLTTQLEAEEARLKLSEFWVEAFGARGLRSLLVDSSLPLLNQEADRVSRTLTGGAVVIEFSATSDLKSGKTIDRFEVRVDNKHGAGSYHGNSAGERAKIDLCVGLALQRLVASRSNASFNVAIFDEAFDALDSGSHERVIEVLAELDKESVYVISHNEALASFFPATLHVVKRDGFSVIEES